MMNHTILLVDDDVNLLEALERQLHGEAHKIVTAQSGQEALSILENEKVDVVVSDQEMPAMKGTQFLWQARKSFPEAILLMLTGKVTTRMVELAVNEVGIYRVFTKPCNAADLALTIRHALQHRDLMSLAKRLLRKVRRQNAVLKRLEQASPGITREEADGREMLAPDDGTPSDYDGLIRELHRSLGERKKD